MDEALHDALTAYIRDLYAPEDDALQAIRAETEAQGMPLIQVRPEEGRTLHFLLAAIGAQRVVEIGTLAGYSGVWIARALPPGGLLITLEYDERHTEVARRSFEGAGVADKVEIRSGRALDTLKGLSAEGPFDAVFIDADKQTYPAYLDWAVENVRPGGLILGHNAFLHGAIIEPGERDPAHVEGVRAFNRRLADDPRLLGLIIPVGDGIAAALRR